MLMWTPCGLGACTRHVTHESQWLSNISASGGFFITASGENQIPIEVIGRVELEVIASDYKGGMKKLTLHGSLYATSAYSRSLLP